MQIQQKPVYQKASIFEVQHKLASDKSIRNTF